jgi:hypothetical protein
MKLLIAFVLAGAFGSAQVFEALQQSSAREFDAVSVKPIQQKTEGFTMRYRVDSAERPSAN